MRSYVRRASGAFAAVAVIALLTSAVRAHSAAARVLPAVALEVEIDAIHYRRQLVDAACTQQCLALRNSMADSLRAILKVAYPFLNWVATGRDAPDTVRIRWIDRPPADIPGSRLDFLIRGPVRRMSASHIVDFEDYPTFARRNAVGGWQVDSLRRDWVRQLRRDLLRADLLVKVFGKIPIDVRPRIVPPSTYVIPLSNTDIGAAEDSRPTFVLQTLIADPATVSRDAADITLGPCRLALDEAGYSCSIPRITYPNSGIIITHPDSIAVLLRRSTVTQRGVQIIEMERDTTRFHGAVFPSPRAAGDGRMPQ